MTAVTMCAMLITAAALMYAAFTVVPSAIGTMEEMNASMQQLSATMTGIDKMVGNVNTLVEDNMDAVTESLGKVQAIDIDKLNESIAHMSDVLEPLANISNFFGGKS
jgi:methyl-accepting chemotaxis protein